MTKDFLHITDFTTDELLETLDLARFIKSKFHSGKSYVPFSGKTLAMIFAMLGVMILIPSLLFFVKYD